MQKFKFSLIAFVVFLAGNLRCEPSSLPEDLPASISFVVVDLKYSEARGVQICEIQSGLTSTFIGYGYLYGKEDAGFQAFTDKLSLFDRDVWYLSSHVYMQMYKQVLQNSGCRRLTDLSSDSRFMQAGALPVEDAKDIFSYHGILIGTFEQKQAEAIKNRFPGILLIDSPFYRIRRSKDEINRLLSLDSVLSQYKPDWGIYPKRSDNAAVQKILNDIDSELLVIKPIGASLGHGIIIIERNDLQKTLEYIFKKSQALASDPDAAYRWWVHNRDDHFLVEEYAPSDPILVPHFDNQPYEPVMRVFFLLAYHNDEIHFHPIGCYWRLPEKSLLEPGSLNDRLKTFAPIPYYTFVDPETWGIVEEQLGDAMKRFYRVLLSGEY